MTRALRSASLLAALTALGPVAAPATASSAPHLKRPDLIAAGPDGNLWVTDAIGILRVTPRGHMTRMAPIRGVGGITAGPDGQVWFTDYRSRRVGRIAPDGQVSYVTELEGSPGGIATGGDGNVWVAESPIGAEEARIARVTPGGAVTEFSDGLVPGAYPHDLIRGPDGDVWFADSPTGRLGRIAPDGRITEYKVFPEYSTESFEGITAGPDGAVWFTANGIIGRFAGPGRVRFWGVGRYLDFTPDIAAGPDGNLWFTTWTAFDRETVSLGRVTPEGDVRFFGRGLSGTYTEGITAGPDGNLWATEHGRTGSHVVRMSTKGIGTEFPRTRPPCRVPPMARMPLDWAQSKLFRSLCALDPASERAGRERGAVVLKVSPPPGSVRPYGTRVNVKFGPVPRPDGCELPYASRRVAATKQVLVYSYKKYVGYPSDTPTTVFRACLRPRGRPHTIDTSASTCCASSEVRGVIAAGRYVAYESEYSVDRGGYEKTLVLYDVARAKHAFDVTVETRAEEGYPKLGPYAVSWRGALAWFATEGAKTRLFVHIGRSTRRVDIGNLSDLRFDGDRLRWRKDGKGRSTRVR